MSSSNDTDSQGMRKYLHDVPHAAIVEQGQAMFDLQRLFWASRCGNHHVPVRRDNALVSANFADVDVTLNSPAFLEPRTVPANFANGTVGPTSNDVMDCFIRSIAERNGWATYKTMSLLSEEGRSLSYVLLSEPDSHSIATAHRKLRIWIQGAVHGNEPAGDQAILALLGKMDANTAWAVSLLKVMDIMILPRYNPDGVAEFQRTFSSHIDANRDHVKLASEQTRGIKGLFVSFNPHVAIDMHEFAAASLFGGRYLHASDALFSAAKNLNVHSDIRRISENLFAAGIASKLERDGFRWEPYVTTSSDTRTRVPIAFSEAGSDSKIGRNAMGLTQCIAFLCEGRGIALADQHFQRRTAAALAMLESIIQIAADSSDHIYQTVENAIAKFIKGQDDIIVMDDPNMMDRTFTMVDTRDGAIVQVPVRLASTTPTTAKLRRRRPEAYVIPDSLTALATRLSDSGVDVQKLDHSFNGMVEAYIIEDVTFGQTYFEGIVPVTVRVSLVEREVNLPAGNYWVSTRQKNAALAFVALEPENIDSYVSCNVVPVEVGGEYPIYKVYGHQ